MSCDDPQRREIGEARHEKCRWGVVLPTENLRQVGPFLALQRGINSHCTWAPEGPAPPWAKELGKEPEEVCYVHDCAACLVFAPIEVDPNVSIFDCPA